MSKKLKFRDVYYGLQKLRDFFSGRKYTLHNRFTPLLAPRSIPRPDIPKSSVVKYSDNYYVKRNFYDSVKPPVIAPVAEGPPTDLGPQCAAGTIGSHEICFACAPTPGPTWWWDGHCYYVETPACCPPPKCGCP